MSEVSSVGAAVSEPCGEVSTAVAPDGDTATVSEGGEGARVNLQPPPQYSSLSGMQVSFCAHGKATKCKEARLDKVLRHLRDGHASTNARLTAVRNASTADALKAAKSNLPMFLFSGLFKERNAQSLVQHSSLLCLDLDDLGDRLDDVKAKVSQDKHTLAAFISPGCKGLKVLVRAHREGGFDAQTHKAFFRRAQRYYRDELGLEIDAACSDVSRGCYLSYDPDLYVNEKAAPMLLTPEDYKAVEHRAPKERGNKDRTKGSLVRDALECIEADCDYATWRNVIFAIAHWQPNGEGESIAREWSQTAPGRYDDNAFSTLWESACQGTPGDPITLGTLFQLAREAGWEPPRRASRSDDHAARILAWTADFEEELGGKVACVGKEWYRYDNKGTFDPMDKGKARKEATAVLGDDGTHQRVSDVMLYFEDKKQVGRDALRSAIAFENANKRESVLVNCANGVLRVTAEGIAFLPWDARYMFSRRVAAKYDPTADISHFEEQLTFFLPDEQDQELLLSFSGYLLYPACDARLALFAYGLSGTGKSTLFEHGLANALGNGLVTNLGLQKLCDARGYELPSLAYSALNLGAEAPAGELAQSDQFKILAEGGPLPVRCIYGEPFTMRDYHVKMVFLGNHMPRFRAGTDAELERMRFLKFTRQLGDQKNATFKKKMQTQRNGIFSAVMVPMLQVYMQRRAIPAEGAESQRLRARFAVENDPVGSFVKEKCVLGGGNVAKSEIIHAFREWCKDQSLPEKLYENDTWFFRALYALPSIGQARPRVDGARLQIVTGMALKDEE